jgi:hypothetical protein
MIAAPRVRRRLRLRDTSSAPKPTTSRSPQSQTLLEILNDAALFHSPDHAPYAEIKLRGHRETWKVRSSGFRNWLSGEYYRRTGGAPNPSAVEQALRIAEARAKFDAVERPVYVRVGGHNGSIYIDLADPDWRAVKIDGGGWKVVKNPEVRFVRATGMLPLRLPARGGNIGKLRHFINVKSNEHFSLIIAWLLATLREHGPYPVLTVIGEQGSAKSTLIELLRLLVDPNVANLRSPPRDDRDLFISAGNSHVLAYDNLSSLPSWLSDGLARISTGAAYATRALYTDQEEVLVRVEKPVALNGITDIVNRADLADRCIFVTADCILKKDRKTREEVIAAFEAERAGILGALLDAVSCGIRTLPRVTGSTWPRMADFAKWAAACEPAFTTAGSFKAAYESNQSEAVESLLEDDILAVALQKAELPCEGSASEILQQLNSITDYAHMHAKQWPKDGKALSSRLRRLALLLRSKGINAEKLQRTGAKRGWRLAPISAEEGKADLVSSPSSASTATAACTAITGAVIRNQQTVKGNDDRDISDDQFAGFSGRQHTTPEAAYEKPRIRDDAAGPPARQFRQRKRTPLRPR